LVHLLAAGANVHARDDAALREAVHGGHDAVAARLLAAGANAVAARLRVAASRRARKWLRTVGGGWLVGGAVALVGGGSLADGVAFAGSGAFAGLVVALLQLFAGTVVKALAIDRAIEWLRVKWLHVALGGVVLAFIVEVVRRLQLHLEVYRSQWELYRALYRLQ
jgi:hypothetical protein